MTNKPLSELFIANTKRTTGGGGGGGQQDFDQTFFNEYQYMCGVQLAERFPDISDLSAIDSNTVEQVARFSLAITPIIQRVWDEYTENLQIPQNVRHQRAA